MTHYLAADLAQLQQDVDGAISVITKGKPAI